MTDREWGVRAVRVLRRALRAAVLLALGLAGVLVLAWILHSDMTIGQLLLLPVGFALIFGRSALLNTLLFLREGTQGARGGAQVPFRPPYSLGC